jgi:hypothetical protein
MISFVVLEAMERPVVLALASKGACRMLVDRRGGVGKQVLVKGGERRGLLLGLRWYR